jgi:hypothetical protein
MVLLGIGEAEGTISPPHPKQNFARSGFWVPQFTQNIVHTLLRIPPLESLVAFGELEQS